jgi:CheY-like chemotaxis protein
MDSDIQRSLAAGFLEHITKPVDMDRLRAAIARAARAEVVT